MVVLLRDYLNIAKTAKECRNILNRELVKVNNEVVKDARFSVGIMDVIEMLKDKYIMLPTKKGIFPVETKDSTKLSRIDDKKTIKGGKTQLNLHDGRNLQIKKDDYATGDVIVHEQSKIKNHLPLKKGSLVLITGGKNIGKVGSVKEVNKTNDFRKTTVIVKVDGNDLPIPKNYVFVVGEDKPVISLGEEE